MKLTKDSTMPSSNTAIDAQATQDDLKALCAAFGTTSGAPMIHVRGHTPECAGKISTDT